MTTDLIARLREPVDEGGYDGRHPDQLHIAAADALEAKDAVLKQTVAEGVAGFDAIRDKLEASERENAELKASRDWYKRRCDLMQSWQSKMRDPERTMVCDILANGQMLEPAGDRYEIKERDSLAEQVKVLMQAIIDYRKGNLLAVARASSDDFAKNADLADWDEIDLEESLASSALFRIADAALATGGK